MEEYFVNEIVQSCGKGYETEVPKLKLRAFTVTMSGAPWEWQIGAFAVFFSWIDFIFILKYISYTAIPINIFLSTCVKFLELIFLLLVATDISLWCSLLHGVCAQKSVSSSEVSY